MASTDAPEFQLKSNSRSGSYKTRKRRWRRLRKFLLIFHPAVFGTGLLFAILAWKANRILNTPITNTPRLTVAILCLTIFALSLSRTGITYACDAITIKQHTYMSFVAGNDKATKRANIIERRKYTAH